MNYLNREALVRTIAHDLMLQEQVVGEVIDRLRDVAIEELSQGREFRLHRLLSVTVVQYKAYRGGKGWVPAQRRLKIRLSSGVNKLFRLGESGAQITRDNWRQTLTDETTDETEIINPFLND